MKASLSCSCGGVVFFYGVGYLSVPAAEQSTEADFFFPILLHRLKMGPGLLRESGQAGEHRSLAAVCSWRFLQGRPVGEPGARGTCGVRAVLGGLVCPNMLQAVTVTPLSSLLQCNSRV